MARIAGVLRNSIRSISGWRRARGAALVAGAFAVAAYSQESPRLIFPEQRHTETRDPTRLPRVTLPDIAAPPTVSSPLPEDAVWEMSLDEAIRIALANADVVRVVGGAGAVAAGPTIYDPAITNNRIDQARARFDPTLEHQSRFDRLNSPSGTFVDPGPPPVAGIGGVANNDYVASTGVSKTFTPGGNAAVRVNSDANRAHASGLPLNPQTGDNVTFSVEQPLLQGRGRAANLAPILIARVDTERSFFRMKSAVQDMVAGVIDTYWNLSFAQVDVWARRQQVRQGKEALDRAIGRLDAQLGDVAEVAQTRVAYNNFRANLVTAESNRLNQEAVLRNLLGLPPADGRRLVPSTPPLVNRFPFAWQDMLSLAEQFRPDVIELKLVLEADQQQLLLARNVALPKLNAVALYRWNGLQGTTPEGRFLSSDGRNFQDWQMGVNFSVPIGLRRDRSLVREREVLIARDQANLRQSLHSATHELAADLRNLAQFHEQYLAYGRTREAAYENLERQLADFLSGRRTLFLNVLQAITDWGNSVSLENQALTRYNSALAQVERSTGTILESRGVRFVEERYRSIGPLGRIGPEALYPMSLRPGPNEDRPVEDDAQVYRRPDPIQLPTADEDPNVFDDRLPPRVRADGDPADRDPTDRDSYERGRDRRNPGRAPGDFDPAEYDRESPPAPERIPPP